MARERPSLPLWGRWHGGAVTEEVIPHFRFAEIDQKNGALYCASPAPFGGTLPFGEGFLVDMINFLKIRGLLPFGSV